MHFETVGPPLKSTVTMSPNSIPRLASG